MSQLTDLIHPDVAIHLPGLFQERVKRSASKIAYRYFDKTSYQWQHYTWQNVQSRVAAIQQALTNINLQAGQSVGIMSGNCPEWMMFEQAALGLGLIVVPLYPNDRADNVSYIVNDAAIQVILVAGSDQCCILESIKDSTPSLKLILSLKQHNLEHDRILDFNNWINDFKDAQYSCTSIEPDSLASIVYTSGTTGRPKGVMLSHNNILQNAYSASQCESFLPSDIFLSFLPLSHMFERTAGYYMPMLSGSEVAYARSIDKLGEDLLEIKPTILITVPRIFERVYNKIQIQLQGKPWISKFLFDAAVNVGWRWFRYSQNKASWHPKLLLRPLFHKLVASKILSKLGGNLRLAVSGGAALSPEIARTFIGLGLNISQGYGMTELSPVVSTNLLHDNEPDSVGQPLLNVEVKLSEEGELLVKGPNVMLGYLHNQQATDDIIDRDGWLHTGDKAKIINDHIYITGRIKDILVLSNGEKVPPNDIELAITNDPLFEQAIVFGEAKPYLCTITVINEDEWLKVQNDIPGEEAVDINSPAANKYILNRIKLCLHDFPGYARIYKTYNTTEAWTVENGLATPTLKLKRKYIFEKFKAQIDNMYKGH